VSVPEQQPLKCYELTADHLGRAVNITAHAEQTWEEMLYFDSGGRGIEKEM